MRGCGSREILPVLPMRAVLAAAAFFSLAFANATRAQDFTIDASPSLAQGCPESFEGGPAVYDVSLESIARFSDPVTLSVSGLPAGAVPFFAMNPATPPINTSLTIDVEFANSGTTSIEVTGTSGMLTHSDPVQLEVLPDCTFAITSPQPLQCDHFQVQYPLAIDPLPRLTATVTLTTGAGLPAQALASFDVNPVEVPGTSTLTLSNLFGVPPGSYPFQVEGYSAVHSEAGDLELVIPVDWQNELGNLLECDACTLMTSSASQPDTRVPSTPLFARIYESGVTEPAGESAAVTAEIGYGPLGSDPRTDCSWRWFPASFNAQVGSADEYVGTLQIGTNGSFATTFRFSLDGGDTASAADLDGAGSGAGLDFSAAAIATVIVPEPGALLGAAFALATLSLLRRVR